MAAFGAIGDELDAGAPLGKCFERAMQLLQARLRAMRSTVLLSNPPQGSLEIEASAWPDEDLSLIAVPISVGPRCVGALSVYFDRKESTPFALKLRVLQALASAIARGMTATQAPGAAAGRDPRPTLTQAVEQLERRMIQEALQGSAGNVARAARALGITERILRYKADKYGLAPQRSPSRRKPPAGQLGS
jgi:transcriptional regulator with GAF, ATPase, and Fis domain